MHGTKNIKFLPARGFAPLSKVGLEGMLESSSWNANFSCTYYMQVTQTKNVALHISPSPIINLSVFSQSNSTGGQSLVCHSNTVETYEGNGVLDR